MLNRKRNERRSTGHDTRLIAHGMVVRGDLRNGTLHLDGRIEGSVLGEGDDAIFPLSEHGHVRSEIRVPQAVINGHVTGDVHVAVRLELASQVRIDNDRRDHTMEMAAGPQVNDRMVRQPGEAPRELLSPGAMDVSVAA